VQDTDKFLYSVSVYKDVFGNWTKIGATFLEPIADATGYSSDARAEVSLSGDGSKLAIANVKAKRGVGTSSTGIVKLYSHSFDDIQGDWISEPDINPGDDVGVGGGGNFVGLKISLSSDGSRLAVGMQYHDATTPEKQDSGTVVIYSHSSSTSAPIAQVTGEEAGDYAGSSVMISRNGMCVVFGSTGDDTDTGTNSGSASVYCADNDANETPWQVRGVLSGEDADDGFGFSVATDIDATFIAVGSIFNAPNGEMVDAGHVRVYMYNGTMYNQLGTDIDGARGEKASAELYYAGDLSGFSIALSDVNDELNGILRLAIGSPNNNGAGRLTDYYNGHVRLFQCNPGDAEPAWTQVLDDLNGETSNELSGHSISMSKDGRRIVVGSPYFDSKTGLVKVYEQTERSDQPSSSPSVSVNPSVAPSNVPSVSANPSVAPSNVPSISSNPSTAPSAGPSVSAHPSTIPSNEPSTSMMPTSALPVDYAFSVSVSGTCQSTPEIEEKLLSIIYNSVPSSLSSSGATFVIAKTESICATLESRQLTNQFSIDTLKILIKVDNIKLDVDSLVDAIEKSLVGKTLSPGVTADSIGSVEPSDAPSLQPSVLPSSSAPSQNPSSHLDKEFEIRSTFNKFDPARKWCLTAERKILGSGSKIHVRPCGQSYNTKSENLQLWKRDEFGQIKLAGPTAELYCIKSMSRTLTLASCSSSSGEEALTFQLTGTEIKQIRNKNLFLVGFDTLRKFSRLRLFKEASFNESLDKWRVRYEYETSLSPSISNEPSESAVPSGVSSVVPSVVNNCVGDAACDDANNSTIGIGGCVGAGACQRADDNTIGNEGCVGVVACRDANANSIGNGACNSNHVCQHADNNAIGDNSCLGQKACYDANDNKIGNGGCVGMGACNIADNNTIGNEGCVGDRACFNADGNIIGDESCVGKLACEEAVNSDIGANSCNCDGCCMECGGTVPDDSCNSATGIGIDANGKCEYCHTSLSPSISNEPSLSSVPSFTSFLIINADEIDVPPPYYNFVYEHPSIVFQGMGLLDGLNYDQNSGFANGIVSPRNVLFNANGSQASMSCPNGSFNVRSMYMTPARIDNLQVTLVGSYDGIEVTRVTLQLGSWKGPPIQFQSELSPFRSIDKLTFSSQGQIVAIDDLVLDNISACTV